MQANFKVKLGEKRTTLFSVFFPLLGLSVKGKIYALGLRLWSAIAGRQYVEFFVSVI